MLYVICHDEPHSFSDIIIIIIIIVIIIMTQNVGDEKCFEEIKGNTKQKESFMFIVSYTINTSFHSQEPSKHTQQKNCRHGSKLNDLYEQLTRN